jgi:uncharacterized protein
MARTELLICFAAFLACSPALAGECAPDWADLRQDGIQARFRVEIADDEAERSKGLMFRESMPSFAGMLFVYDTPKNAVFWMKNTLIPLDMLFLDQSGAVIRIISAAEPLTTSPRDGGPGVQYVLEINGGMAGKLGLTEGAELRHPAIANPAWACTE